MNTVTVLHTCDNHGPHVAMFTVEHDVKLSDGVTHRYSVIRCDGSPMEVYSDDPDVEVSE